MIKTILITSLEKALNTYLHLDADAFSKIQTLEGKIIALQITDLKIKLYFFPDVSGILVLYHYEAEVDTMIQGTSFAFLRWLQAENSATVLLSDDMSIEGNTQTGEQFSQILKSIDIDWDSLFASIIGDNLAHRIGQFSRKTVDWLKESTLATQLNTIEYLQEEIHLLPTEAEITPHLDQVDILRMDVDRLEARLNRLKAHL